LKQDLRTTTGQPIVHMKDAKQDERFVAMTENPFLHGCCDCGLFHRVEYKVVDGGGFELELKEGVKLALRFSRDDMETAERRLNLACSNPTAETREVIAFLGAYVPHETIEATKFSGVPINDLDRDSLLRLVALLAAGKPEEKEESSIILLGGKR
jgi:hypothetical protein